MASQVEQVRRALNSDATKAGLFRLLENDAFQLEPVAALFPELADDWQKIGNAMQVPWQFVMVLDLTMAAAMAPTAVLFPLPTLPIHPVLWWFLFHPGAYNTSGIIKLYGEVLQLVEEDINAARAERRRTWAEQRSSPSGREETWKQPICGCCLAGRWEWQPRGRGEADGTSPQSWTQHLLPDGRQKVAALAAGRRRGQRDNRSRLVRAYDVEALHSQLRSKLHPVDHPYFLAAGALHVEDVIDLFVGNDPLGIRGRLGLFYARGAPSRRRVKCVKPRSRSLPRGGVETHPVALCFRRTCSAGSGGVFMVSYVNVSTRAGKHTTPCTVLRPPFSRTFAEGSGVSTSSMRTLQTFSRPCVTSARRREKCRTLST